MNDRDSFNMMVEDVQLVDDHVLLAKLRNGHWSRLDLDFCLGNADGEFQWGGKNFSETATEIRLTSTGHEPRWPMLHARLRQDSRLNDSGEPNTIANTVNLSEFIGVENGELTIDEEVLRNPRRPSM